MSARLHALSFIQVLYLLVFNHARGGGGRGVLRPFNIGCIGICGPKGYGLSAVLVISKGINSS